MAFSGRPIDRAAIQTERDGKVYAGTYSSDNQMVTVYFSGRSKKAHLGNSSPEILAMLLLGELVTEATAN